MFAGAPVAYWIGFFFVIGLLIAGDLFFFGRGAGPRPMRNLAGFLVPVALAVTLAFWLAHAHGHQQAMEWVSGYLIELSLSVDNLFVFLVMFRSFGLSAEAQRKALTAGIAGSILMRGLFMFFGIALLDRFAWIEYVFGAALLVAALRLLREGTKSRQAEAAPAGRRPKKWLARLTGQSSGIAGGALLSAIVAIELADLVFALDSIPAVLAVTRNPFVAYTSNIFAVLGLRSLYFLLSGLLERLRFLHFGLAAILAFVGFKMLASRWVTIPVDLSLGVIVVAIAIAAGASLLARPKPLVPRPE
jgi:tellurite resistance protein TerC